MKCFFAFTLMFILTACTSGAMPADKASPAKKETAQASDPLSEAELWRVVSKLASDEFGGRDEGTPGGIAARKFIINKLQRCGIAPKGDNGGYEQKILTGKGANVLGWIQGVGATKSTRTILISAHYDHLGVKDGGQIYNGAYDNAAAVSVVLGAACALARKPLQRSVLVALWDSEEPPTFLTEAMGSQYFTNHPTMPMGDIDVAIVLDLIGSDLWKDAGMHFVLGSELSPEVSKTLERVKVPHELKTLLFGLHLVESLPTGGHQPWSDYDAFRNLKVPVLFLSDGFNERYHTTTDELNQLVKSKLPLHAQYLTAIVRALGCDSDPNPRFVEGRSNYLRDAQNIEVVLAAAVKPGAIVDNLKSASKVRLLADLKKVRQIKNGLLSGAPATAKQITTLRNAVQRIMCYTSSGDKDKACDQF